MAINMKDLKNDVKVIKQVQTRAVTLNDLEKIEQTMGDFVK